MYMVTLVRTQRGVLYKWSRQKCTWLHWYAHREGCCTNGAGRSVHGYIGTHTERGAVQMEQAEVYMVTLVRTQRGVLYKWSRQKCTCYIGTHTERGAVQIEQTEVYRVTMVRTQRGVLYKLSRQKCTGYTGTHTQRDAVQIEQAEVYRVSAWTREAKNGEGADKAHGEKSCVTSILFLVFQTGQS